MTPEEVFDVAFRLLMRNEGGFLSAEEAARIGDPGGATNFGVTQRALDDALERFPVLRGRVPRRVGEFSEDDARAFYSVAYWFHRGISSLTAAGPGIAIAVFDAGVQHGVGQGVLFLQKLVGAEPDGIVGADTLARLTRYPNLGALMLEFHARRRQFVISWVSRDARRAKIVGGLIARIDRTMQTAMRADGLLSFR